MGQNLRFQLRNDTFKNSLVLTLSNFCLLCAIGRVLLFIDVFADYSQKTYLFFSTLSTYLFLATALAYQLLVLQITFVSRKVFLIEGSHEDERLRKHNTFWRRSVGGLILAVMLAYIIDFIVEQGNGYSVNQLNRGTIIGCYGFVGIVFIYFSCRLTDTLTTKLQGFYDVKYTRKVS